MDHITNYANRKFGYCVITWDIKNYCISPSDVRWTIESSEFFIGGIYLTKWRLRLKRFPKSNLEWGTIFELERLDYGQNYQVWVDCKLFFCNKFEKYMLEQYKLLFPAKDKCQTFLKHSELVPVHTTHCELFKLKLELLVHFRNIEENVAACNDLGIHNLGIDLHTLYEKREMSDILFRVHSQNIYAHKCVVYHRIRKTALKELICSKDLIILSDDCTYDVWDNIFRFLYTGNMKYVLADPLLNMYQSAVSFGIDPIISYYVPDRLTLSTTTEVEEINFIWTLKKFSTLRVISLLSPVLGCFDSANLRFKVDPGFGNRLGYVGVFLEAEVETPRDVCLEISINNSSNQFGFKRIHQRISGKEVLGTQRILKKEILKYFKDDTLIIGIRVRISTGAQSSSIGRSETFCRPYSEQQNYYELSKDMMSSYRSFLFCDFTINIFQYGLLKFHKCILSARCKFYLNSLLKDNGDTRLITFEDRSIMNSIFELLYSGKLSYELSFNNVTYMYGFAEKFKITHLKITLCHYLQKNLNPFNAVQVYEFAEIANIESLKAIAFQYIDTPKL